MSTENQLFEPAALEAWKKYERVRKGGRYNMFDPRARQQTGLSREQYSFVIKHYSDLKEAIHGKPSEHSKDLP